MANLDTRTVLTNGFTQTVLNGTLVTNRRHVDEVDNNQAAEVTKTQLASDFIGRFKVGIKCGLFDIAAARGACGVDINCGQCFGAIDNDRTPEGRRTSRWNADSI